MEQTKPMTEAETHPHLRYLVSEEVEQGDKEAYLFPQFVRIAKPTGATAQLNITPVRP